MSTPGKLFLIPTTLGDTEPLEVLPISVKKIIEQTDHFIVENEKSARRFIKRITPKKQQSKLNISVLDKYTGMLEAQHYLDPCIKGVNIGLLSEAGAPAVADPGAVIVQMAHEKGIRVVPLVGPSSILLAMMASGLNGQNFAFNGYLPIDKGERKRYIKQLEKVSFEKDQSQLFIETPYRNEKLFDDLIQSLSAETLLCIAVDISMPAEFILTKPVAYWKHAKPDLHKKPAIFIIHKK